MKLINIVHSRINLYNWMEPIEWKSGKSSIKLLAKSL